jgi:hypothetical protein
MALSTGRRLGAGANSSNQAAPAALPTKLTFAAYYAANVNLVVRRPASGRPLLLLFGAG